MNRFFPVLSLCGAVLACVSHASAEDSYEIKFARSFAKGAKFTIDAKVTRDSDNEMTGMGPEEKGTLSVELKGLVEVQKVDDKGRIVEATCKVEKCIVRDTLKSEESQPFPAGHVITIRSTGGKLAVDTAGKTVYEKAGELLPRLWPWNASDAASPDDAVFGTTEKKKVGDTWKLDGAKVVAKLAETTKLKMDPAKTTATGKLLGLIDVDGVKCLDVEIEISIPDVDFSGHLAMFEPAGSKLAAKIRRALPVDAKLSCPRWTDSCDWDLAKKGTGGYDGMKMKSAENEKHELNLKPAK